MTLTIKYKSGTDWVTTSQMTWLSMTHLAGTPITSHIQIEGGKGLGYNFSKGSDNAVCTIQGLCPWTSAGIAEFDSINGNTVQIIEDIEGTHTGLAVLTQSSGGNTAWISFTLSFTEDSKEA